MVHPINVTPWYYGSGRVHFVYLSIQFEVVMAWLVRIMSQLVGWKFGVGWNEL